MTLAVPIVRSYWYWISRVDYSANASIAVVERSDPAVNCTTGVLWLTGPRHPGSGDGNEAGTWTVGRVALEYWRSRTQMNATLGESRTQFRTGFPRALWSYGEALLVGQVRPSMTSNRSPAQVFEADLLRTDDSCRVTDSKMRVLGSVVRCYAVRGDAHFRCVPVISYQHVVGRSGQKCGNISCSA